MPHGAGDEVARRSGANRAFGSPYARLGEITQRRLRLLVDHRIIAALQTTRESYERRHSWMLAFTDFVIDANEQGELRITFGTATEGTRLRGSSREHPERQPRLRRQVRHAMRGTSRQLKQSSGELMDWYFVADSASSPHGPVAIGFPKSFYFRSPISWSRTVHESSSKATGAH